MKKVAIIQSNYIPWKGYFDFIHDVDEFIFLDNVQFTTRDWRTRNSIKTTDGLHWLTVPAGADRNRLICEVILTDHSWQAKHWRTIKQYYSKAPYFELYKDIFEDFYMCRTWNSLSEMNQYLTRLIAGKILKIETIFKDAKEYNPEGKKFDLIADLVVKSAGNIYVSGPAAKNYMNEFDFTRRTSAKLIWKDYSGYPEYPQLYPPFEHCVSVLDLLFNTGEDASHYIWGWRNAS